MFNVVMSIDSDFASFQFFKSENSSTYDENFVIQFFFVKLDTNLKLYYTI